MGIRDQRIEIGTSIKTIIRCVYDIRSNSQLKFQMGFVQYDNNEIPVWRPFDPEDMSLNASWRNAHWENIYTLRMSHKKSKYVEYELDNVSSGGLNIALPKVLPELAKPFENYLCTRSQRNNPINSEIKKRIVIKRNPSKSY